MNDQMMTNNNDDNVMKQQVVTGLLDRDSETEWVTPY